MIEKVNPAHPDKVADRIAGAIVDLAYKAQENPKCAVEVLIGHGQCHVIIETSAPIDKENVAFDLYRHPNRAQAKTKQPKNDDFWETYAMFEMLDIFSGDDE